MSFRRIDVGSRTTDEPCDGHDNEIGLFFRTREQRYDGETRIRVTFSLSNARPIFPTASRPTIPDDVFKYCDEINAKFYRQTTAFERGMF